MKDVDGRRTYTRRLGAARIEFEHTEVVALSQLRVVLHSPLTFILHVLECRIDVIINVLAALAHQTRKESESGMCVNASECEEADGWQREREMNMRECEKRCEHAHTRDHTYYSECQSSGSFLTGRMQRVACVAPAMYLRIHLEASLVAASARAAATSVANLSNASPPALALSLAYTRCKMILSWFQLHYNLIFMTLNMQVKGRKSL